MKKKIIVQKKTEKQGTSASGKAYTKFGICDANDEWYNSFQPINAAEGGEYEIEYESNKYGNDLKSIIPLSKTDNQTANMNRQNSIIRQHSQEMSLRELEIKARIGELQEFPSKEELTKMIDWYVKDTEEQELPF